MTTNVGFRVFARPESVPDRALLEALETADVAHITDAMNKFGVIDSQIRPIYEPMRRVVGPALTVKVHPGDHLMIRKAMSLAQPGDVLVIDSRGDVTKAVWGGMVSEMMVRRQLGGVIIDGAARDAEHIKSLDLPLWARGVTPTAPTLVGPGEINGPVACGNVVVFAGDVVVADQEGVVVVPAADLGTVIAKIEAVVKKEKGWMNEIETGAIVAREAVDSTLESAGATIQGAWTGGGNQ